MGSSPFVPPERYAPQLQSTCLNTVNHYVKIWHMRLGVANNMHTLGCGTQKEKLQKLDGYYLSHPDARGMFFIAIYFEMALSL